MSPLQSNLSCPRNTCERRSGIDISFNSSILAKRFPFIGVFSFWEEEKVNGGQVLWIRWLRHDYDFLFGQKLKHKHRCVNWWVFMVQNPWLVFPQIYAFLMNCFSQSAHNFKVVFLIDRKTWWQEFRMHHMLLESKKIVSKTFTFDQTWRMFFALASSVGFHWDDLTLIILAKGL